MGTPVAYCAYVAAVDSEEGYQRLLKVMTYNIKFGSYTQVPCRCTPSCRELTDDEGEALQKRLREDTKDVPRRRD